MRAFVVNGRNLAARDVKRVAQRRAPLGLARAILLDSGGIDAPASAARRLHRCAGG
jgi:hypothetical protein